MSILATKDQFQRAIDKARALGGVKLVHKTGEGRYSVLASNGRDIYRVAVVSPHRWTCDCQAGRNDRCCYHLAACWLYRLGEQMKPEAAPAPAKPRAAGVERPSDPIWGDEPAKKTLWG